MRTIEMSDYTVGRACFDSIPDVLNRYRATKVCLVGSAPSLAVAAPQIKAVLQRAGLTNLGTIDYGTHCTQSAIDAVVANPAFVEADVVFAIGGGADIDTVKAASKQFGVKTVFSVPTACSTCSASTALAVVYNDDGTFKEYVRPDVPAHIFINQEIIAKAPASLFWAGIGDALSKQPEVEFACSGGIAKHTARLGLAIARSCSEPLFEFGAQALEDVRQDKATKAVQQIVLDIIVNTGYVSNLMNQPDFYHNSSLAHAFFNATCGIERAGKRHMHGEVVSFGVLVLLAYAQKHDELERYARFNASIGLPVTLAELDLSEEHLPELGELVQGTSEWQAGVPEPFEVERFLDAVREADALGKTLL